MLRQLGRRRHDPNGKRREDVGAYGERASRTAPTSMKEGDEVERGEEYPKTDRRPCHNHAQQKSVT